MPTPLRLAPLLLLAALASACGSDASPEAPATPEARDDVLAQAEAFLDTDRPIRAARLLRSLDDPGAGARLLAARAEAGAENWVRVRDLLGPADSLGARGLYLLARAHDGLGDGPAALAAYDAFLGAGDTTGLGTERGAARLRRALVLVGADPASGREALDRATAVPPDWRAVLEAEALARAGDVERTEAVASRFTTGARGRLAWAARIEAARRSGDLGAARTLARRARAAVTADDARAQFALTEGRLAAETGDTTARGLWRDAITTAPGSQAAREAAALLREGTPAPADWLALAETDRALGLNGEAADAWGRWLASGEGTPEAQARVRLEAADALFDAQRYGEMEALLAPLMVRREARELWAGALSRMGRAEDAAALYLELASGGDAAPNLYFAADALHGGGETARALALYRRVEAEHAGTRWAGLATMRRAGQAFLDGDHAEAARLWDGYAAQNARGPHALRSRYWAGRALAEGGDASGAERRFRAVLGEARDSYYALLASEALGEAFWPVPMSPSPPEATPAADRVREALRGVDVLREAGFEDAAEAEVDRAVSGVGGGQAARYALAEALVARGYGQRAIRIGQGLGGGTNRRRLRILYPFPYRRMIAAEAEANGVGPFVAAALIRQESQFAARAVSPVGARGLMQLMPATARALADEEGLEGWDPAMLFRPEVNVRLGARYVGQQAEAYGGDLPAVFGAYNAGPHQIEAWRQFPEWERGPALFTERIPFRETRDYVKILTRNRAIYEGLYGAP